MEEPLPAGERVATGDASRELAEEGALAETGIAVEDGDLACREPTGREPVQSLGRDLTQGDKRTEALPISLVWLRRG